MSKPRWKLNILEPCLACGVPTNVNLITCQHCGKSHKNSIMAELLKRTNGHCEYCGKKTSPEGDRLDRPSRDHRIAVSHGGNLFSLKNSALSCVGCNEERADMPLGLWLLLCDVRRTTGYYPNNFSYPNRVSGETSVDTAARIKAYVNRYFTKPNRSIVSRRGPT